MQIRSWLIGAILALLLTTPAFAQFQQWPNTLPAAPAWGDYDPGHTWRDAHGGGLIIPNGQQITIPNGGVISMKIASGIPPDGDGSSIVSGSYNIIPNGGATTIRALVSRAVVGSVPA